MPNDTETSVNLTSLNTQQTESGVNPGFQPLSPISTIPPDNVPRKQPPVSTNTRSTFRIYIFILFLALFLIGMGGMLFARTLLNKSKETVLVDESIQRISERGTLIIGTDATFPPMEFTDTNGEIVGYDVDLGKRIAEVLGLQAQIKNISWDDLFVALEKGEVDIVISGVTITEERKTQYAFSNPYLTAGQVIITQKTNQTIRSTNDLKEKKIAVQDETTNKDQALLYTRPELVIPYENFVAATQALVEGQVDAIFSDVTNAKGIVTANPTLTIASDPFTQEQYGIVVHKSNEALLKKVNEALIKLRQQGVLTYLKHKWLE